MIPDDDDDDDDDDCEDNSDFESTSHFTGSQRLPEPNLRQFAKLLLNWSMLIMMIR